MTKRLEIREDILKKIDSDEASNITGLMALIYLRLIQAPEHLWPEQNVLRFEATVQEGVLVSPWKQLLTLLKVSPATARKALSWMEQQRILTYSNVSREEILISFEGISRPKTRP
jgi:hypothetical protein